MNRKLTLGLTLAIIFSLVMTAVAMAQTASTPTITSDLPDYGPGDTVTLTGAGWQANEVVHVYVNDDWGSSWNYPADVTADADGGFVMTFQLPTWFVATYSVTATGSLGSTAYMTFTDSVTSVTITSPTTASPLTVTSLPATITVSFNYVSSTSGTTKATADVLGTSATASKDLPSGTGSASIVVNIPAGTPKGSYGLKVTVTNTYGTGSNNKNDNLNNAVVIDVALDTTPPVISCTPMPNQSVWYAADVSVLCSASDGTGSGLANLGDASFSLSTSVANGTETISASTGTRQVCDVVGNCATAGPFGPFKVDKNAPSVTITPDRAANEAGWYNTTIKFTVNGGTDLSGVNCTSIPDYSGPDNAAASVGATCTDGAGNTGSGNLSFQYDGTAPVVTCGSADADWHAGDQSITCTAVDATAGLAKPETDASFALSTTVAADTEVEDAQTGTYEVVDAAGNSKIAGPIGPFKIDKKPPQLISCDAPDDLWHKDDVTLYCHYTDGGSGPEAQAVGLKTDVANDVWTENAFASAGGARACDNVSNCAASPADIGGNKIDKKAPTISAAATTDPNIAGWYNANVTVHFTCADDGSGVPAGACPADQVLSYEGAAIASAAQTVTDAAGNVSDPSNVVTVKIDKTKPTISAAATTTPNAAGWYKDDVTIHFTCTDNLSDFAAKACPADEVLSAEGAAVASTAQTVTDLAGNVSDASNIVTVKIDKTKPTVSLVDGPADDGSYYFGFVPAAPTCSADDALSGVDGTCSVGGYGAGVGSHTVTASATDKAGNSGSASATYTVLAWTLNGFFQPVDMNGVFNTVKNGSTVPLKFEIFAGPTELTSTLYVKSLNYGQVACDATAPNDAIETTATGGTALRYDATAGQFVYNWKTPATANKCYSVTMTTLDGSSLSAFFKLK